MCEVSSSYDFGKMFLLGDKGRREEEEEVSKKIKKRTKIRGVPGCWPEHLTNLHKFELNWSSKLRDKIMQEKNTLSHENALVPLPF